MSSFNNSRVWFITGSSKGLGKSLLEAVLAAGERAVATLRNPQDLDDLKSQYTSEQLVVVRLDVSNESQIFNAFAVTRENFGRLDVCVNNAGYGLYGEIEGLPEEEARKQIEVLFWGPVRISKEAVKFMRDINPPGIGGKIFNISSSGGYSSNPCLAFYSAGKFALEGFTEALKKEMVPAWEIGVSIIEPGGFATAWKDTLTAYPAPAPYDDPDTPSSKFRAMMDLGGAVTIGSPERAAAAFIQLANMTATELPIRIQFGSDSYAVVRNKAQKTMDESDKWAKISHSTNNDGVDPAKVLEQLSAANY